MKFDKTRLDEEFRMKGEVINFVLPYYTKTKMKIIDKLSALIFKGKKPSDADVEYKQIYCKREDETSLRICVYSKKTTISKPKVALIWLHGGGFAMSEPEQDYIFFKQIIKKFNAVVFAPDYTKSLEKPFPAGFEDVKKTFEFVKTNASEYNIDSENIFVGGDSAGGSLAVSLSIYSRDKGDNSIKFCMPIYPMLSSKHTESSKNNNMPVWNTRSNDLAWKIYLQNINPDNELFKYASPAAETNFEGLPEMLTYVGTEDPFFSETLEFFKNLENAKVKTSIRIFEGCFHGFDVAQPKAKKSLEAKKFLLAGFEEAYNKYIL